MRILLNLTLVLVLATHLNAQDFKTANTNNKNNSAGSQNAQQSEDLPKFYLGIGSGINSYVGMIGLGADVRILNPLFIRAGIGIGSWGTKTTIGIKYERKHTKGWVYGIAYESSSGLKDFKTKLEVDTLSSTIKKEVTIDLLRASSVNLTASYNWIFKKHNKFFIEFGYGIRVEQHPYKVKDNSKLTNLSIQTLRILSPGGLVFGLGVMFAL
jgi:hypothetical protein